MFFGEAGQKLRSGATVQSLDLIDHFSLGHSLDLSRLACFRERRFSMIGRVWELPCVSSYRPAGSGYLTSRASATSGRCAESRSGAACFALPPRKTVVQAIPGRKTGRKKFLSPPTAESRSQQADRSTKRVGDDRGCCRRKSFRPAVRPNPCPAVHSRKGIIRSRAQPIETRTHSANRFLLDAVRRLYGIPGFSSPFTEWGSWCVPEQGAGPGQRSGFVADRGDDWAVDPVASPTEGAPNTNFAIDRLRFDRLWAGSITADHAAG